MIHQLSQSSSSSNSLSMRRNEHESKDFAKSLSFSLSFNNNLKIFTIGSMYFVYLAVTLFVFFEFLRLNWTILDVTGDLKMDIQLQLDPSPTQNHPQLLKRAWNQINSKDKFKQAETIPETWCNSTSPESFWVSTPNEDNKVLGGDFQLTQSSLQTLKDADVQMRPQVGLSKHKTYSPTNKW